MTVHSTYRVKKNKVENISWNWFELKKDVANFTKVLLKNMSHRQNFRQIISKNIQTCWIWKRSYGVELFVRVKSLNDECFGCSLLQRNLYQYGVHAKIIVFCKMCTGCAGCAGCTGCRGCTMNGLLGKKIQEMGRKKLTNGVKNSLKLEENSGMV